MSVLFILILVSMSVAGGFLGLFIWAVLNGQFDDTQSPSWRALFESGKCTNISEDTDNPITLTPEDKN